MQAGGAEQENSTLLPVPERAMSPLFRPCLAVVAITAASGAAAQSTQPWSAGQAVWNSSTGCFTCHTTSSLDDMRRTYTTAAAARTAIESPSRNGAMRTFVLSLTTQQRSDVAAYVADIRAEGNIQVTVGASAAMTVPAADQTSQITVSMFNNGRSAMQLDPNGITVTGADSIRFTARGGAPNSCLASPTVAANGGSCQLVITYRPVVAPATQHTARLSVAHNGEPQDVTSLDLTGRVVAAPPPPPPPPSGDGGGGSLAPGWLALLLPAALLARRRLSVVRRASD